MEEWLSSLFDSARFGNILNCFSIALTLVAFGLTFLEAKRSRTAAEAARLAVFDVRKDIRKINTVASLSRILSIIDEIKRLYRHDVWQILPDRYSTARELLVEIRTGNSLLTQDDQTLLQNIIVHLRTTETQLDDAIRRKDELLEIDAHNAMLNKHQEVLKKILVTMQNKVGE